MKTKWIAIFIASVMLLSTMVPAVQAESGSSQAQKEGQEGGAPGDLNPDNHTGGGNSGNQAGGEGAGTGSGEQIPDGQGGVQEPGNSAGEQGPGDQPAGENPSTQPGEVDPGLQPPGTDQANPNGDQAQQQLKADAAKTGVYNLAQGLPYEWSEQPEAARPDDAYKLTDGIYGAKDSSDPAWVGHVKKKTREVIIDLGDKKSISNVKAHFLQDWPANNTLMPLTVSFYVSDDKENWGLLSDNAIQTLWIDGQNEETYEWKGNKEGIKDPNKEGVAYSGIAYARYVKVTFTMHTRAWTLIDEIEVLGEDGQAEGAKTVPTQKPAFQEVGEATAGIRNLGLFYNGVYKNGKGDWSKERIIPNISYVDKGGNPQDWLFDGVLYLGLDAPSGHNFGGGGNLEDWKWYLDKTFKPDGDMQHLDEATQEVADKLNQPGHKTKVVLMIPDPGEYLSNFGDIGSGNLDFRRFEDRVRAVQWWLDQVKQKWAAANYSNLELVGMYWLEEQISTSKEGPELLRQVSAQVHAMNQKFFWIPHFFAYKAFMWKDVGIDNVAIQPNYFFEDDIDPAQLESAANLAKHYGMSNELEFDDRMITDNKFREKFIDYLNSGAQTGLMNLNVYKAYYQGNDAVYDSAVSTSPAIRVLYDWLYQFTKGTYSVNNSLPPEAVVQMNGQPLKNGIVVPNTESVQFTWEIVNDDGSGTTSVTATFDGKPYTQGTPIDLKGKLGKHELIVTVSAGKSQKTSYIIEASTNADLLKSLVTQFQESNDIKKEEAAQTLIKQLDLMKRFEGVDQVQVRKCAKNLNAALEFLKQEKSISDKAFEALKDAVYYLSGSLAQGKKAEASSTESQSANLMPSKAVDGNPSSRWASNTTDNEWFQVDLGESKQFDTIKIDWEYARAKTFKLLVSDDGKTWTYIKENIKENNDVFTAHDGRDTIQFAPIQARYVKFQGIQRNTDYGYSFYEFGVYNLSGVEKVNGVEGVKAVIDPVSKKVAVEGTVIQDNPAEVSLKVLDPNGGVQYEAKTTSAATGEFKFEFALSGDVEGNYEMQVTTEGMNAPAKAAFEYKKPKTDDGSGNGNNGGGNTGGSGSSGGGSYGSGTVASDLFKLQSDGSVKGSVSTKLDATGKVAVGSVSEQELKKAIDQAKADAAGKKKVSIELAGNAEAVKYALDIAVAFLTDNPTVQIELLTSKGSVILSGQMFIKSADLGKQLRFIVSEGDHHSLSTDLQAKVGSRPIIGLEALIDGKSIAWANTKAPITVTIPYTGSNQEGASSLGILEIMDKGAASDIAKAMYSEAGKNISFSTDHTGTYAVYDMLSAIKFADLTNYSWAQEAIAKLAAQGIVQGTSATTFSPSDQVSRADFILMVVRAMGLKAESAPAFTDVAPQDYYYDAVAVAKQLGIVTGSNADHFNPHSSITRQDMMVMAARALQAVNAAELKGSQDALSAFKDADKVSGYAADSVAVMIKQGLIQGDSGTIKPTHATTRAEAVVLLHRILTSLTK